MWSNRTEILIGNEGLKKLRESHVLIVGLGGVGAYTAEMLCRAGVGKLTLVDGDKIETTNRNRQLPALLSTEGMAKALVLSNRFKDINPEIELIVHTEYFEEENFKALLSNHFDYVVDAIDTLSPKIALIRNAIENQLPIVSSMGSGGKLDPSKIEINDISKSYNCRLAKVLRKRLGRFGIRTGIKVVFSSELVEKDVVIAEEGRNKKSTVGTISYLPAIFGCFCSSVVIRDLLSQVKDASE